VVRNVPAKYNTLELLNGREQASNDIKAALEKRWEKAGVIVESVSLQEIRYSEEVKGRFDAAQAARIEVEKAKAELEATQVSAQQKVVQAQAEADANAILNSSLTPSILQQRYLDTLKELAAAGNLVVVPEGFNGLVNVNR
jgi:regulator of protease activity HflC (stomatin/prohibitin superfamily)